MAEKKKFIQIRVEENEKKLIENKSKMAGFDSVSAYILYLIRKDEV